MKGYSSRRKGRVSIIGQYYFLTSVTHDRLAWFKDDTAARIVLNACRSAAFEARMVVDAVVVMPDHVHLCGQLVTGDLSVAMNSLKRYTSVQISGQCGVDPPVWAKGFHDHALRNDESYRVHMKYLLENPVRAGLARRVSDYEHLWCRFGLEL